MRYGNYPELGSVKKILVIKLRHLGDVLLTTPVFEGLKRALPEAKVDAFVWKEAAAMLSGNPRISQLVAYDRKWKSLSKLERMKREVRLLRWIRQQGYDLVINLTEGDRGALAALASGARWKVGIDPGSRGFYGKRKIYSHLVKPCATPRHAVERDLDALRRVGIFPKQDERELCFFVPDQARQSALAILDSYGLKRGGYALIHPISRWRFKCPPPALMGEVVDHLAMPVVLTGGPSDVEWKHVEEITKGREVINLAGKTSLKELGALMDMAAGLITVDSVTLHMASALKVPVVALFGPTSELNWGPWRHPHARVVTSDFPCRPCLMDGCGGSKMSDCLWSLSPAQIACAFHEVVTEASVGLSSGTSSSASEGSLLALNSLETKSTE